MISHVAKTNQLLKRFNNPDYCWTAEEVSLI